MEPRERSNMLVKWTKTATAIQQGTCDSDGGCPPDATENDPDFCFSLNDVMKFCLPILYPCATTWEKHLEKAVLVDQFKTYLLDEMDISQDKFTECSAIAELE